ncbi:hypothetical protein C8R46DRAFT_1116679 [Mycena filopes]|nr:hypothetical protein C8R46DRAFT_1116679 [Mycena filopes]
MDALLALMSKEITPLQAQLQRLLEEFTSLNEERNRHKAILSSFRKVPAEILGEIFAWTVPVALDLDERRRFSMLDSPWCLTHVNRRWRVVALENTALWSLVVIRYDRRDMRPSSSYPLPMLKEQLLRAQNLRIHFYGCETPNPAEQVEAFQLLANESSRWEEFSLGVTSHILPLLPGLQDSVPLLRRLWIQTDDWRSLPEGQSIDCFATTTTLVDAGANMYYRILPVPFPVHQLTRYDLSATLTVHLGILQDAKNLLDARISVIFENNEDWPEFPGVFLTLPSLQRLYVSDAQVLTYLDYPQLDEIAMIVDITDVGQLQTNIESALSRSERESHKLTFLGCPDADLLLSIVDHRPSIGELTVMVENAKGSDNLRAFMLKLTVAPYLMAPRLRSLSFGFEEEAYIRCADYWAIGSAHHIADSSSLHRTALFINLEDLPDAATYSRLYALRELGLGVRVLDGVDASDAISDATVQPTWN